MAVGVDYKTLVNARAIGSEVVTSDFFDIPAPPGPGTLTYRILELPLNVITPPSLTDPIVVRQVDPITHIHNPMAHVVFTMVTAPVSPILNQFQIDTTNTFLYSTILFNTLNGGMTVEIIVTGRGSLIYAEDVNDPRDELKDSRDTEADLGTRLDLIEDGTRLQDGLIRPRHISTVGTDDFVFPRKVTVSGDLDVTGNFNITGEINRSLSEIIDITDDTILINSEAVAPGPDMAIQFHRGGADPVLKWVEGSTSFRFQSTTSADLLTIFNTGTPMVRVWGDLQVDGSISAGTLLKPPSYTTAQEAAITIVANIPGIFYNSDERQMKAVVSDGIGGAKLVILG